ncbi:MAG: HD domain-containing protein [Oscillospiraceae bacterium]|nr:HD domain-containing protein [Oscillospiraceae bacterium]
MSNASKIIGSVTEILEGLPVEELQHMRRVGTLVGCFTERLGACGFPDVSADEYRLFGSAAFYHDIGKAWIPHGILTKPDLLTECEMLVVRRHPVFARRLFEQIRLGIISGMPEQLLQLAEDSAVYHHEFWNGSGYPYGISCVNIPLIARITKICDAYDAMTSDRIYRKGHSREHARQELKQYAGIQFDPELVDNFLTAEADPDFCIYAFSPYHESL